MDVVSLAPVPVSSLHWRIADGPWTLSVVCKLTLVLRPERSAVAKRQEPIHAVDLRTAEFPRDRILAPSDLVPMRQAVDVTAFAPTHTAPGSASHVRIVVGGIDKRARAAGNVVHEVAGHAAGTSERPGLAPEPHDGMVLPEAFDWSSFNAAPRDQRLRDLAPDAELLLEGLHPEHPALNTRLPNVNPQAFLERDELRRELPMRIDGLWFDGRRGLCCVTYRTQIPLAQLGEQGKVFIAVAGPDKRVTEASLSELIVQLRGGAPTPPATSIAPQKPAVDESEDTRKTARKREVTATSVFGPIEEEATGENFAAYPDAAPPWLKREGTSPTSGEASAPPVPPVTPTRPAPTPSVPPAPTSRPNVAFTQSNPGLTQAVPAITDAPLNASPKVPFPGATLPAPTPSSPWSRGKNDAEAPAPAPTKFELPEAPREAPKPIDPPKRAARDVIELLWFDADATPKLRSRFAKLADALEFAARDPEHDHPSDDPAEARCHHLHFGLLTEVVPVVLGELRERVRESVSDAGRFTPPVVAATGELSFPFDLVEHLRATAAAMAPLVGDDRKLAEALAPVDELLASPLAAASSEPVQKLLDALRRSFRESRRSVTLEQLEDIVTRSLLEQRKYQRRTLLGGVWIRSLLATPGTREPIPCYLPDALANKLPMMTSFRARVLAEAHVRIDQYEPGRHALRAFTLGRVHEF